jgi:hypothetical protein
MRHLLQRAKRVPVFGRLAVALNGWLRHRALWALFPGSATDWRRHYERGGSSGCGSAGILAQFKAETINAFVLERGVDSVIEFGCGDGGQLLLAKYPRYIGLDIAPAAIARCKERFAHDLTKSFFLYDPHCFVDRAAVFSADLALSLDVIFHLVEDELFELHMRHLLGAGRRHAIIYSSNHDERTGHPGIRHRKWTDWVEAHAPDWRVTDRIPNRYPYVGDARTGSFADFYVVRRIASR